MSNPKPKFHWYIRLDANHEGIPGSVVKRPERLRPKVGEWVDITECVKLCCNPTTTTSTTTTTTTTTP